MNFILLLLLLTPIYVQAGEFDLEQLLLQLGSRHPRVLVAANNYASLLENSKYKKTIYPDPKLGISWVNYPYKKDLTIERNGSVMSGVELRVVQPLPFPGKLSVQSSLSSLEAEEGRLKLASEKNNVVRDFLNTLIEIYKLSEMIRITEKYMEKVQVISDIASVKYSVGKGDMSEVSKAIVFKSRFHENIVRLKRVMDALLDTLEYYQLGEERRDFSAIRPEYLENYLEKSHMRIGKGLDIEQKSVLVAMKKLEQQKSAKNITLSKLDAMPDFEVFAAYRKTDRVAGDDTSGEKYMSAGVAFKVPLWSGLSARSQIRMMKNRKKSSQMGVVDEISRETAVIRSLQTEIRMINERMVIYSENLIPQAGQSVDSARLAYETGKTDFDRFMDAWNTQYSLETGLADLKAQRLNKMSALAYYYNEILPQVELKNEQ